MLGKSVLSVIIGALVPNYYVLWYNFLIIYYKLILYNLPDTCLSAEKFGSPGGNSISVVKMFLGDESK